jgi:hypothetical protein
LDLRDDKTDGQVRVAIRLRTQRVFLSVPTYDRQKFSLGKGEIRYVRRRYGKEDAVPTAYLTLASAYTPL